MEVKIFNEIFITTSKTYLNIVVIFFFYVMHIHIITANNRHNNFFPGTVKLVVNLNILLS